MREPLHILMLCCGFCVLLSLSYKWALCINVYVATFCALMPLVDHYAACKYCCLISPSQLFLGDLWRCKTACGGADPQKFGHRYDHINGLVGSL